jgi:hypothetical protein
MKGKFRRTFKIIAAVIRALSLLAAGAVTGTVRKSWPQETGAIQIAGLKDKVEVVRDKWGVAHIYASNQHDLFVAQGYRPRSLLAKMPAGGAGAIRTTFRNLTLGKSGVGAIEFLFNRGAFPTAGGS